MAGQVVGPVLSRRELLRLTGSAAALTLLPRSVHALAEPQRVGGTRLFFSPSEIPRIRAGAASSILSPVVDGWAVGGVTATRKALARATETGILYTDFRAALKALREQGMVHLVDPDPQREAVLLEGIDQILAMPKWDYMVDGDETTGLLVASVTIDTVVFLREVLGDALGADREAQLLADIAEKGCAPCSRILDGMEDPSTVTGWRMDDHHSQLFDIDFTNWPVILATTNLRAVPAASLGIGALAIRGHDDRANAWLDQAVHNTRAILGLFNPDGSYHEGFGYATGTMLHIFGFLEAHQRGDGSIRWADEIDLEGMVKFYLSMQAGRKADGTPDIVNFGDAWNSGSYCVPAWLARQLEGTPAANAAQFAVERGSYNKSYLDVLWVDPDRAVGQPPSSYLNVRLDSDWISCRTGWAADDAVLAFRSGGPGNHEHADRNHIFYKVYGERLLTDPQKSAYDWRQPKWLLRLPEAHNSVLIDGVGHQYHNGREGTNPSQAEARITRYAPDERSGGDRVWWTSDATPAYAMVNDTIQRVRRTVLFQKPDVVVVFDEIDASSAVSLAARFHPENRDGSAGLSSADGTFRFVRPHAALTGHAFSRAELTVDLSQLDLPADGGIYPFAEVSLAKAQSHQLVTVLCAMPTDAADLKVAVTPDADGWTIAAGALRARIELASGAPEVTWA
jgi:hypothetical protein